MVISKKSIYKPKLKKLAKLKFFVLNKKKILKFKKKKWFFSRNYLSKLSKIKKYNCFYKFYDSNCYTIVKFNNKFTKNYSQDQQKKKKFGFLYGNLRQKYLKKLVKSTERGCNNLNKKDLLLKILESRLDIVLLRAHFCSSIRNARQLISHGNVFVNDGIIYDSSFILKKGDVVSFSKKSRSLIKYSVITSDIWPLPPKHIQISYKLLKLVMFETTSFNNTGTVTSSALNLDTILKLYS